MASVNPRITPLQGALLILTGTILWSTGGVGVKWLTGEGNAIPPFLVSASRSSFAALVFLVAARGRVLPPRGHGARWFWLGAGSYSLVVTGFVLSTFLTTAANSIILQDIMPLWILLLSKPMLGESPRPRDFFAMAIGLAGVFFCMRTGFEKSESGGFISVQSFGDIVALFAGFMFALLAICMRKFSRDAHNEPPASSDPAMGFLFFGNVLAAMIGILFFAAFGGDARMAAVQQANWSLPVLLVFIWLGIFQLGGGYLLAGRGMRAVPAFQASMLMLAEPVLNPLWVALAVGEIPARDTLIGGGLILCAMVFTLWGKER